MPPLAKRVCSKLVWVVNDPVKRVPSKDGNIPKPGSMPRGGPQGAGTPGKGERNSWNGQFPDVPVPKGNGNTLLWISSTGSRVVPET